MHILFLFFFKFVNKVVVKSQSLFLPLLLLLLLLLLLSSFFTAKGCSKAKTPCRGTWRSLDVTRKRLKRDAAPSARGAMFTSSRKECESRGWARRGRRGRRTASCWRPWCCCEPLSWLLLHYSALSERPERKNGELRADFLFFLSYFILKDSQTRGAWDCHILYVLFSSRGRMLSTFAFVLVWKLMCAVLFANTMASTTTTAKTIISSRWNSSCW